ncbi:MAG: PepSY-like domain-containing protein [Calditrichaeota bacterium]|nr:PepSY-like domain-containing protein [Calditrichota bacterium]
MKIFKISVSNLLLIVLLASASLISCEKNAENTPEQDQEETVMEIPQAVKLAFDKTYPGAEIKEFAKETEDGQVYYEVACVFEGRRIDASYKPNGTVAATEEVISSDILPEAVKTSITKEFKNYTVSLAEKVQKDEKVLYELKLEDSEHEDRLEVIFSETGQLVKKSGKSIEHEEESEESEDDD